MPHKHHATHTHTLPTHPFSLLVSLPLVRVLAHTHTLSLSRLLSLSAPAGEAGGGGLREPLHRQGPSWLHDRGPPASPPRLREPRGVPRGHGGTCTLANISGTSPCPLPFTPPSTRWAVRPCLGIIFVVCRLTLSPDVVPKHRQHRATSVQKRLRSPGRSPDPRATSAARTATTCSTAPPRSVTHASTRSGTARTTSPRYPRIPGGLPGRPVPTRPP